MVTIIRMPEVLANSAEAAIQSWLVAIGQSVSIGTPLAEIETEKAVVDYPSEFEGTVLKLLVDEGVSVKVGDPIAALGAAGEEYDGGQPVDGVPAAASPAAAVSEPAPVQEFGTVPGEAATATEVRRFISPLVRRMARERGLDLSGLVGTGPGGRVVRRDIERIIVESTAVEEAAPEEEATAGVPAANEPQLAGSTAVPHTGMRRAIARRLTESKATVPHFYLVAECRVDELLKLRAQVNASTETKVSVNDFVIKAAAGAFADVPEANATWTDAATLLHDTVDISVAVSVESGLLTPVLRSVERQSLTEIARTVADLAGRARSGRLKQHELEGGSFSISNLGMFGVTEFSAIINPPQSAILAVGRAVQRPIVVDGQLDVGTVMTVTLSADHRVIDGALAARWLTAFQRRVEAPLTVVI